MVDDDTNGVANDIDRAENQDHGSCALVENEKVEDITVDTGKTESTNRSLETERTNQREDNDSETDPEKCTDTSNREIEPASKTIEKESVENEEHNSKETEDNTNLDNQVSTPPAGKEAEIEKDVEDLQINAESEDFVDLGTVENDDFFTDEERDSNKEGEIESKSEDNKRVEEVNESD